VEPVSRVWGLDRGQPIDRHYIEAVLDAHAEDISGDVLEVKDAGYTERFQQGARSVTVLDPPGRATAGWPSGSRPSGRCTAIPRRRSV
jgi:hypothetical protein